MSSKTHIRNKYGISIFYNLIPDFDIDKNFFINKKWSYKWQ